MSYENDGFEEDYTSKEARREIRRGWAERHRYEAFLRRRNGYKDLIGSGYDANGVWFAIYACGQDKRHRTMDAYESYQRVRIAMNEPDTALETWIEVELTGHETVVIRGGFDPIEYCRSRDWSMDYIK